MKTAITNLNTFINSVTANTNERPGLAQIQGAIQGEALALSLDELQILRERVATARDAEANNVRKGIYSTMVEELDRIIAERMASGGG